MKNPLCWPFHDAQVMLVPEIGDVFLALHLTLRGNFPTPFDQLRGVNLCRANGVHLKNRDHRTGLSAPGNPAIQGRGEKSGQMAMVKYMYLKWNPGKWNQGLKPAVPWWFNFD